MTLKTYTATPDNTWPEDKEFIWWAPKRGFTEWLQHTDQASDAVNAVWAHRVDGPAIIWDSGASYWWVKGKEMHSWNQFQEATGCSDEEIIFYKLKYGEI